MRLLRQARNDTCVGLPHRFAPRSADINSFTNFLMFECIFIGVEWAIQKEPFISRLYSKLDLC